MNCPNCGEEKHRVIKTWKNKKFKSTANPGVDIVISVIKRVRRCQACGTPWTTTELIDNHNYSKTIREKINGS